MLQSRGQYLAHFNQEERTKAAFEKAHELAPDEPVPYANLAGIYAADSGHAPYGDKPQHAIIERSLAVIGAGVIAALSIVFWPTSTPGVRRSNV